MANTTCPQCGASVPEYAEETWVGAQFGLAKAPVLHDYSLNGLLGPCPGGMRLTSFTPDDPQPT